MGVMAPRSATNPGRRTAASAGRAPWGTISREQVVDAATGVVKNGGYEEMTIRSLAADLGVAPMSLYRHVRDKDDLLDEVVDRLLAKAWRPSASPRDWRSWVVEAAEKLRRFLVNQPAALHVYLQHPVVSPSAIARMNTMIDVLSAATGDEASARRGTQPFTPTHWASQLWKPPAPDEHPQTTKPTDERSNSPPIPPLLSSPRG